MAAGQQFSDRHVFEPVGSTESGQHNEGSQCADGDQAEDTGSAVLVQDHTEQAQDKAKRRRQKNSQPAKG
jgi:hypothetical protein